jgi:hypothetical protein
MAALKLNEQASPLHYPAWTTRRMRCPITRTKRQWS